MVASRRRRGSRVWVLALAVVPAAVLVGLAGGLIAAAVLVGFAGQVLVLAPDTSARLGRGLRWCVVRAAPMALGTLALLVAADWTIGIALSARSSPEPDQLLDLATRDLPPSRDARLTSPALDGLPWADRYFSELRAMHYLYLPFVGALPAPTRGRHINTQDGIRASYEPPDLRQEADTVDVWFFGGSTMWGEGQRDEHTIPSEIVRLAAAEGISLRALNFGVQGDTALQEVLRFEREVNSRARPDLVVFYHGFNDIATQLQAPENLGRQPTIYQVDKVAEVFETSPPLPGHQPARPDPVQPLGYSDRSILHRLAGALADVVSDPAGASGSDYAPDAEQIDQAIDHASEIYLRTMALLDHLADRNGLDPVVFWQPGGNQTRYDEFTERVGDVGGAIDLSHVLDDPPEPVYIDNAHTNEVGARMVAEAMWVHLRPLVGAAPG